MNRGAWHIPGEPLSSDSEQILHLFRANRPECKTKLNDFFKAKIFNVKYNMSNSHFSFNFEKQKKS